VPVAQHHLSVCPETQQRHPGNIHPRAPVHDITDTCPLCVPDSLDAHIVRVVQTAPATSALAQMYDLGPLDAECLWCCDDGSPSYADRRQVLEWFQFWAACTRVQVALSPSLMCMTMAHLAPLLTTGSYQGVSSTASSSFPKWSPGVSAWHECTTRCVDECLSPLRGNDLTMFDRMTPKMGSHIFRCRTMRLKNGENILQVIYPPLHQKMGTGTLHGIGVHKCS
jgi:hypothetical protein